jgi:hypothetical protein
VELIVTHDEERVVRKGRLPDTAHVVGNTRTERHRVTRTPGRKVAGQNLYEVMVRGRITMILSNARTTISGDLYSATSRLGPWTLELVATVGLY